MVAGLLRSFLSNVLPLRHRRCRGCVLCLSEQPYHYTKYDGTTEATIYRIRWDILGKPFQVHTGRKGMKRSVCSFTRTSGRSPDFTAAQFVGRAERVDDTRPGSLKRGMTSFVGVESFYRLLSSVVFPTEELPKMK